jgi:Dolichyl-phosphate-mannose-protein mannosyltransferase
MQRRRRIPTPGRDRLASVRPTPGAVVQPDELTVRRTVVQVEAPPGALRQRLTDVAQAVVARDALILGALLVLAAAVRLPGIATRGRFDGDQGYDMLTLLHFTRDSVFPLLGPPTSIGDFHHGAFYYLLLAPVAAISHSDPVAVVTALALMGVAAVGVTWWLARSIGGRVAGLIAGVLLALSPAAIDESTFLWNPNPIPLFAAIALAAAWHAHRTGRARWWMVSLAGAGIVFQLHVLGIVFLPPVVALLVVDVRRALRAGDRATATRLLKAGLAGFALIALLFVPLAIHELQTDFSEARRAIAYFTGGSGGGPGLDPFTRVLFTLFRIVGWPFVGVVTDAPFASTLVVALAVVLGVWAAATLRGDLGIAARWLAGTVAWSAVALSVLAPSLQTIVAGLPNDHYHAFLDPVVVVLVSVAAMAMAAPGTLPATVSAATRATAASTPMDPGAPSRGSLRPGVDVAARALLGSVFVLVIALEVSRWPLPDPNGGWPAAAASGVRIVATTGDAPVALLDLPAFKTPAGTGFPIVLAGGTLTDDVWSAAFIVVPCDRLFESVIGLKCAGPAEDRQMRYLVTDGAHPEPTLVMRFDASPRISISIYRP